MMLKTAADGDDRNFRASNALNRRAEDERAHGSNNVVEECECRIVTVSISASDIAPGSTKRLYRREDGERRFITISSKSLGRKSAGAGIVAGRRLVEQR